MLKTISNESDFFVKIAESYADILATYVDEYDNLRSFYLPWTYTFLYDVLGTFPPQYEIFDSIRDNLASASEGGNTLVSISISDINKQDGIAPHKDTHPTNGNFKRCHLPLQLTPTSKIHVIGDDGVDNTYEWTLGEWVEFEGMQYLHYPENLEDKARVLLIVDYFVGEMSDQDLYDYYIERQALLNVDARADFRPAYEKFISNR
jgi:hypothetical protein